MERDTLSRLQEEFSQSIADSSRRLADGWAEALKAAGGGHALEEPQRLSLGWWDPSTFLKQATTSGTAARFQEMFLHAAEDLPELLKAPKDRDKTQRIKGKWSKSYEKWVRDMFGVPAPTESERLLRQWQMFLDDVRLPSSGIQGLFLWPLDVMGAGGARFPEQDAYRQVFRMWAETLERTMGRLLPGPAQLLTKDFEARTRKALDAQVAFLKALPGFRKHLVDATRKAMEKIVETVHNLDVKELTQETYRLFFKTWLANSEKALQELFGSEAFTRSLSETLDLGLDARKRLEGLMSDMLSVWNVPAKKDVEELQEIVYTMNKRLKLLEKEVEELRTGMEKLAALGTETTPSKRGARA
jgi:hypothetical protein